jgi:Spy/CpxP family protein refolding chaperone
MNRRGITFVLAGFAAMVAVESFGQQLGIPPGRWWERPRVAEELGLTAEQKEKLETVTLAHARTMIDLKASVDKAELDVKAAAEREPFEAKRVRESFGVLQQARLRLETERFEMLLKVREALSTEQWNRLRDLTRERIEEFRERRLDRPNAPRRYKN